MKLENRNLGFLLMGMIMQVFFIAIFIHTKDYFTAGIMASFTSVAVKDLVNLT